MSDGLSGVGGRTSQALLDEKDVSWWPMNRALIAEGVEDSEEGVLNKAIEREVPRSATLHFQMHKRIILQNAVQSDI